MFDEAASHIMAISLSCSCRRTLKDFAYAIIYRKRDKGHSEGIPLEVFEKFIKLVDDNKWRHAAQKDGVSLYRRMDSENYPGIFTKEVIVLNSSVEEIFEYLSNYNNAKDYEESISESRPLESICEGTKVWYMRLKALLPLTKKRDFCYLSSSRSLGNRIYALLSCSVDHKEVPDTGKYIRAIMDVSGLLLRPLPSNPLATEMHSVVQLDMQGNQLLKLLLDTDWLSLKASGRTKYLQKKFNK